MEHPAPRAGGERLGPYELVRRLGEGGMGEVWEAVLHGPAGFAKPVALKCLRSGAPQDGTVLEALLREARLGARLQHPNVVGTLGVSEHGGSWVVALELVRGATLSEVLRHGGPLPGRTVAEVGVQVAAALEHVHDAGLVHRDVKPSNLLVDRVGLVRLGDLGISLFGADGERVAGTYGYLPPEQAEGHAEPRSDLFALGATLYLLATGRRPFGTGVQAVAAVGRVEELLASTAFLAPLDDAVAGLGAIVRRCLRADPGARWPTARALGEALGRLRPTSGGSVLLERLARVRPGFVGALPEAPTRLLPSGNLATARDRFVGRAVEVRDLRALVLSGDERLVVLLGPGGTGKTRLALEVARCVRPAVDVCAFGLSEARAEEGICAAVARGLGLDLERSDPVDRIGRALASRGRAVVVLDNLEQCVEHLPRTLGRWLDLAPEATFLCTSRVTLGLRGERRVGVGPLDPADAVALFRDRATRPVRDDEAPALARLCDALEGMPLAIELAAARTAVLGVVRILDRLSVALLAGVDRERPERHRSMAASLRWSMDLLSAAAQRALPQLSVLDGRFALEAAEAVLDLQGATDTLDVLTELCEASLLRVDGASGRFSMLVVVREYAGGLLSPDARRAAEVRHGTFFAQWGTPEASVLAGARGDSAAHELDDLVAACRRAVARRDGPVAVATLLGAWSFLILRGPYAEAAALATAALGIGALAPHEEAATHHVLGSALTHHGALDEAEPHVVLAVEGFRRCGDRRSEGNALGTLANLHRKRGRIDAARALYDQAPAVLRERPDPRIEGTILASLGILHHEQGRPDEARTCYEAALQLHRAAGSRRLEGIVLGNLANVHRVQGRTDAAFAHQEAALAIHREVGDRTAEGVALGNLGNLHASQGRHEQAIAHHEAAIDIHRAAGARRLEGMILGNLANALRHLGRYAEARARYDAALAVHREVGNRRHEAIELANLAELHVGEGRPADARANLDVALILAREVGDALFEAFVHGRRGVLAATDGDLDAAWSALGESERLLRAVGAPADLAELLAVQVEVAWRRGSAEHARACLAEAERLAPAGHAAAAAAIGRARAFVERAGGGVGF